MNRNMDPAPSDEQELDSDDDFMQEVEREYAIVDGPRRIPRSVRRPLPPSDNFNASPQSRSQAGNIESAAEPPKDKGKGKEMRSDVQVQERPLNRNSTPSERARRIRSANIYISVHHIMMHC